MPPDAGKLANRADPFASKPLAAGGGSLALCEVTFAGRFPRTERPMWLGRSFDTGKSYPVATTDLQHGLRPRVPGPASVSSR